MKFYLSLGSNIGDRRRNLGAAIEGLENRGVRVVSCSSVYETEPVGGPQGQPAYLNQVIEVQSPTSARDLLSLIHETESSMGRDRSVEERWGPRAIDIDIVLGDESVSDTDLVIPHVRAQERAFVMIPLAEIAPDVKVAGERASDLVAVMDHRGVQKVDDAALPDTGG